MGQPTSIRFPKEMRQKIEEEYPNLKFSKAMRKIVTEYFHYKEERPRLSKENEELKKAIDMLRLGVPAGFSTKTCKFLDYDRQSKSFCRNKKAPIDTSYLTPKACSICSAYEPYNPQKTNVRRTNRRSPSTGQPKPNTSIEEKNTQKQEKKLPKLSRQPRQRSKVKTDLVWCPHREEQVYKVKCEQCMILRFKVYRSCQEKRLQNPNDPIFQPLDFNSI